MSRENREQGDRQAQAAAILSSLSDVHREWAFGTEPCKSHGTKRKALELG